MVEQTAPPTPKSFVIGVDSVDEPGPKSKFEVRSWLFVVLIIVFLIALGFLGYFFYQNQQAKKQAQQPTPTLAPISTPTPTPDPIANWNAYTNQKYSYTVKYPQNYSALEVSSEYVRFFQGVNDPNLPLPQTYVSIQLDPDPDSSKYSNAIYKTTLDGKAFRITQVIMGVEESQKTEIETVFDQILSTFQFLDQETAGWETYENDELGFSIRYPPEWTWGQGNLHAPSLPSTILTFRSEPGVFDFTLVPTENADGLSLEDLAQNLLRLYFGEVEVTSTQSSPTAGKESVRTTHVQPVVGESQVSFLSTFVTSGTRVFWMFTQFEADPKTNSSFSDEDQEKVRIYELMVQNFQFLD